MKTLDSIIPSGSCRPGLRAGDAGETRYEQLARRVQERIERGTLRPGDRIPSVRQCSGHERVSVATVLQAYRCLEDRGWIEARPQSGYYVKARHWTPPPEPVRSDPGSGAVRVYVSQLTLEVIQAARRPDLVPLGAALPDLEAYPLGPLNRALSVAARRHPTAAHAFEPPPGWLPLRRQIARRALEAGCELAPDDILVTVGATEALSLALRAVASPGDTIAIESPCFFGVLQMIESLGMRACEIPTCPRDGVGLEDLRRRLQACRVRACVFSPNFSNPLGSRMPDESKAALVRMLTERRIPLIEDDIYGNLAFGVGRPRAAKSYDRDGWVLLCDSFTKTLSPGIRLGWIAPGRFREKVALLKYVSTGASPTLPQMAVADFLQDGGFDHHLRRVRLAYTRQLREMSEAIGRHFPGGTRLTRPTGGMCLWVELPGTVDAMEMHRRALESGISIAPGPMFSPKGRYRQCIRISVANPWSPEMEAAVIRLGRIAGDLM
ncbi:MAG: PLP-dependent aminotransferase family protein [Verrucomicrobiota bacterium]